MAPETDRAMSFGAIATDYDRLRPSPPPVAVRWLLPARCEVAVDLAAGTGLLTRVLAAEVSDVVAVEPDARMASVLKARSPGVHVVSGRESVSASEYRRRRRDVHLPDAAAFANAQDASFTFTRSMTVDDLVAMLGTYSGLITASPAERAAALGRARAALTARFGDAGDVDVPMRSLCWRADRAAR